MKEAEIFRANRILEANKKKFEREINMDLKNGIRNLIKDLKEERESYKWDVRYGLYGMIIKRLEALIEETPKVKKGG